MVVRRTLAVGGGSRLYTADMVLKGRIRKIPRQNDGERAECHGK